MHLSDLLNNNLIINSLAAWAAAQLQKTIIYACAHREWEWERLFGDGGMPSGHSATVTALSVTAGIEYGLDSAPFAIAAILAVVVGGTSLAGGRGSVIRTMLGVMLVTLLANCLNLLGVTAPEKM